MADWTNVADATLEPGKPIRAIDARALRENPIAIAEGAPGAPKIQTAGITDANVTAAKLATGINERAWVGARIQETAADEIGSIMIAWNTTTSAVASRGTIAGSSLRYMTADLLEGQMDRATRDNNTSFPTTNTTTLSGTWRNVAARCPGRLSQGIGGDFTRYFWYPSIWVRVS